MRAHNKINGTFRSVGVKTTESGVIASIIKLVGDEKIFTEYAGNSSADMTDIYEDTTTIDESDLDIYEIYLIDDGDTLYFGVGDNIMDGSSLDRLVNRLDYEASYTRQ